MWYWAVLDDRRDSRIFIHGKNEGKLSNCWGRGFCSHELVRTVHTVDAINDTKWNQKKENKWHEKNWDAAVVATGFNARRYKPCITPLTACGKGCHSTFSEGLGTSQQGAVGSTKAPIWCARCLPDDKGKPPQRWIPPLWDRWRCTTRTVNPDYKISHQY